ncbi:DUF1571 domain-containing protein [Planctomicrobium sp. SH664]|uniref:DUF1571 domain-containing protein n=1 Tax=Planctomicrobium sp. SH664 TaxID=3448125 RepID=UPI003F5C3D49
MARSRRAGTSFRRNFLASLIAASAVGFAQLNFDPVPSGSSPHARAAMIGPPTTSVLAAPKLVATASLNQSATPLMEEGSRLVEIPHDPALLRGVWGLKLTSALLAKGCSEFARISDYTAVMYKQERIRGTLGEGQNIDLKIRHEPFSVYMKWLSGDRGRQCIYVDGQNEGKLLVQPGGIRGRATGVLSIDPNGSLALAESRHPITMAGLLGLAETILEYQRRDLERAGGFTCELRDNQTFENRPCYLCITEYDNEKTNPEYRKSMIFIDKELSMPICVKNYGWGRDVNPETIDEETLIEFYAYSELKTMQQLGSADFDQHNKEYKLRVKK